MTTNSRRTEPFKGLPSLTVTVTTAVPTKCGRGSKVSQAVFPGLVYWTLGESALALEAALTFKVGFALAEPPRMPVKTIVLAPAFSDTVKQLIGSSVGAAGGETVTVKLCRTRLLFLPPLFSVTVIVDTPVLIGGSRRVNQALLWDALKLTAAGDTKPELLEVAVIRANCGMAVEPSVIPVSGIVCRLVPAIRSMFGIGFIVGGKGGALTIEGRDTLTLKEAVIWLLMGKLLAIINVIVAIPFTFLAGVNVNEPTLFGLL